MSEWPSETTSFWNEVESIVEKSPPSDTFKTDWVVRSVPLYSWKMMSYDTVYLADVINYLQMSNGHTKKICSALRERERGHNQETWENHVFTPTKHLKDVSVWTIKCFHHWMTLKNMLGHRLLSSYTHIIEVGGGMGESARVLYDTYGFENKRYTIVDLPSISNYAKRNLEGYPVEFTSDVTTLPIDRNTLVFSTWGLSEISLDLRKQILDHCRKADLFVTFQAKIFDIDNRDYFCRKYPSMYNKSITLREIPLHTIDGGNFYMLAI